MNAVAAWIGVDVGGTSIKLGAITPAGQRLGEARLELSPEPKAELVLERLAQAIASLVTEANCTPLGMGIGLPGLLDRELGVVQHSPNLPWLQGLELRARLAHLTGMQPTKIPIENDANVAALGEQWLGAAAGEPNVLTVTLGTGIGGGLVIDGRLFLCEGQAGEIGHLTVDPAGLPCGCGSRGCLETLASARATERRARALGLPRDKPGDLVRLAEVARLNAGPERELLEAVGRDLGHGIGSVLCLMDLRCFVFAGGFSAAFDLLEPGMRRGLAEWSYGERVAAVRLLPASLGSSAGWIGAARLLAAHPSPPCPTQASGSAHE